MPCDYTKWNYCYNCTQSEAEHEKTNRLHRRFPKNVTWCPSCGGRLRVRPRHKFPNRRKAMGERPIVRTLITVKCKRCKKTEIGVAVKNFGNKIKAPVCESCKTEKYMKSLKLTKEDQDNLGRY